MCVSLSLSLCLFLLLVFCWGGGEKGGIISKTLGFLGFFCLLLGYIGHILECIFYIYYCMAKCPSCEQTNDGRLSVLTMDLIPIALSGILVICELFFFFFPNLVCSLALFYFILFYFILFIYLYFLFLWRILAQM